MTQNVWFKRTALSQPELYKMEYIDTGLADVDAAWLLLNAYWYDADGILHPTGSLYSTYYDISSGSFYEPQNTLLGLNQNG